MDTSQSNLTKWPLNPIQVLTLPSKPQTGTQSPAWSHPSGKLQQKLIRQGQAPHHPRVQDNQRQTWALGAALAKHSSPSCQLSAADSFPLLLPQSPDASAQVASESFYTLPIETG